MIEMIDSLANRSTMSQEELELMKKLSTVKHKEILRETL